MRNECLRLIGDSIKEYAKESELAPYKKYDGYKIWVDMKAQKFKVQMDGMEVDTLAFETAESAIRYAGEMKNE